MLASGPWVEPDKNFERIFSLSEDIGRRMRYLGEYLFPVVWVAFLVYWQVASSDVKATERLEPAASRLTRAVLFLGAIGLLMLPHIPAPWLYRFLYPPSYAAFFGGAALTVAGLGFSVWARRHLGSNWSRSVTIKRDHELIMTGPYALARHPIYTGILVGFLGSSIAEGQVRSYMAFAMVLIALWVKLRLEERWMREQFGTSYEEYRRRVAALVPFVL